MSTPTTHAHGDHADAGHAAGGHHTNYVKVWAVLMVLFVISVTGPMIGIRSITLITAFGIAVVKAYLVAKYFMHLDVERKFVVYLLVVCLGLLLVFFAAVSPDVMKHFGMNWVNRGAENRPAVHATHGGGHDAAAGHEAGAAPAHEAAPAGH